jgi:hypothetical protein
MAEYIEREAAIAETRKPRLTDAELRRRLSHIPAADVAPVRHGTWVYNPGDNIPYCSECMMPQDSECNFCPNCGAMMEK